MAAIDFQRQEIGVKIVYWGPALSGKTTNVKRLHGFIPSRLAGELATLDTEDDRTIFFDYLPVKAGAIERYRIRLQVFSVPGQAHYRATRQVVLQSADGVIFVADSQPQELEQNLAALRDLEDCLRSYGHDPQEFPTVFLYNKRDLPGALPVETLRRELGGRPGQGFEGVAIEGKGVLEAFNALVDRVTERLRAQLSHADVARSIGGGPLSPATAPVGGSRALVELVERIADQGEHAPAQVQRMAELVGSREAPPPPVLLEGDQTLRLDGVERAGDDRRLTLSGGTARQPISVQILISEARLRQLLPEPAPPQVPAEVVPPESPVSSQGLIIAFVWLAILTVWLLLR